MSDFMSLKMSNRISKLMPEFMSNRISDFMLEYVMVGIFRNEVIWKVVSFPLIFLTFYSKPKL